MERILLEFEYSAVGNVTSLVEQLQCFTTFETLSGMFHGQKYTEEKKPINFSSVIEYYKWTEIMQRKKNCTKFSNFRMKCMHEYVRKYFIMYLSFSKQIVYNV